MPSKVETVIDGVERYPPNGINVVIVGAGNGGLNAALECWRKGCDVLVLERTAELSRIGDFFTITPSALTTLKNYPRMFEEYHSRVYDCLTSVCTPSGQVVKEVLPEWRREGAKHAVPEVSVSFLNQRPVYAKMQLEQCERLGIEVKFGIKGARAEELEDGVVVHTDDGDFKGDICIASDGVASKVAPHSFDNVPVQDSGYAVARVAFPLSTLKPGSPAEKMVKPLVAEQPRFRAYLANDVHLILFLTPDSVAWCLTHRSDAKSSESWSNLRDAEDIIKLIENAGEDWDPAVLDFVRQTPTQVIDWSLLWRDSNPDWTSPNGRVIKLGDAAHTFFPTAGSGAVQAIEDGNSLAECLHQGGKANAAWSTKVHNRLRFERCSILQQTGFVNREELHNATLESLQASPDQQPGFFKIGRWVWGHDPEAYAREKYEEALGAVRDGKEFVNTNIPPGHVYEPWTMASEMQRMMEGRRSTLKENGDWGM